MKKICITVLLVNALFFCQAQLYKIQNAIAFYTVSTPGKVMIDMDGHKTNPPAVYGHFIYIETNYKNKPRIDSVFYNNVLFTGTIDSIKEKKHQVGINAATGKPIILTPKKGNYLWMMSLQQVNGSPLTPEQIKKISFKCKLGTTNIKQIITKEIQLTVPDMY